MASDLRIAGKLYEMEALLIQDSKGKYQLFIRNNDSTFSHFNSTDTFTAKVLFQFAQFSVLQLLRLPPSTPKKKWRKNNRNETININSPGFGKFSNVKDEI